MKKLVLICSKCGKRDLTTVSHVGTLASMICPDCTSGKKNRYGSLLAGMCRDCCPTGHGTREED